MHNRTRLKPDERKRQIINAAFKEAGKRGPYNISIISVSRRLKDCSKSTIKHYYPNLTVLRDAVIQSAINNQDSPAMSDTEFAKSVRLIIVTAITMNNPLINDLPKSQKQAILSHYG